MRTHEQSTAITTLRHCYSSRFMCSQVTPAELFLYRPCFINAVARGFYSFTKWCKFLCKLVIFSITNEITSSTNVETLGNLTYALNDEGSTLIFLLFVLF
ncbi:hypothetical protein AXX17_AT5G14050 [Arabidopsis thaliana]|jgi:hypothetical protein|uniref:Uncharacterized protein n=1 Tax=Arabidopsis thaliana TaxID=3702 RepID=A0A178UB02_ARATH|nr:hypothetical protein AXX17_AT5G14050 [Arabidopsis thaliana]